MEEFKCLGGGEAGKGGSRRRMGEGGRGSEAGGGGGGGGGGRGIGKEEKFGWFDVCIRTGNWGSDASTNSSLG